MSTISQEATIAETSLLKQPRSVWAVFFACIIAFMGLGLVDPILPAIAKQLHASQTKSPCYSPATMPSWRLRC